MWKTKNITLHLGDCLEVLQTLEDESVSAVVTDPPYDLTSNPGHSVFPGRYKGTKGARRGFMGKQWDGTGIAFSMELWKAILRVAKPGAMLLAFGGARTHHRMTCAIEDVGWQIRDCIMWLYGSGFPKSLDIGKQIDKEAGVVRKVIGKSSRSQLASEGWDRPWKHKQMEESGNTIGEYNITTPATDAAKLWDGYGTGLKPAYEPIIVAMKPLDGTFAENAVKHGVAGMNIDGCRVAGRKRSVPQSKFDSPTGKIYGFKTGEGRTGEMSDNSKGRWPSNVILDEVAAQELDRQSGGIIGSGKISHSIHKGRLKSRCKGAEYDHETLTNYGDSGGASRFFYVAKTSSSERNAGLEGMEKRIAGGMSARADGSLDGHIVVAENFHPTVKPIALMQWLIKLVSMPKGGIILDPFMGSGTTGTACIRTGNKFIGIELEKEYFEIAKNRIRYFRSVKEDWENTPMEKQMPVRIAEFKKRARRKR